MSHTCRFVDIYIFLEDKDFETIRRFANIVKFYNNCITSMGCYKIDYSNVCGLFGSLITYIVVFKKLYVKS